jgi:hypothetical protein
MARLRAMFGLFATLLRLAITDPVASSWVAASLAGEPSLGAELVAICRRESRCRPIGAHPRDAASGPLMRRKALAVGWLDEQCVWHHGDGYRFSTRGAHGLSASYSLRFLPGCLPPEALDVPLLSAVAATRRAQALCRSRGACNRLERHRFWMGARKWDQQKQRELQG